MLPAFVVVFVAGQLLGGHLGIVSAVVDRGETFESFMSIGDFLNLAEPSLLEDDVVVAESDVFAIGFVYADVEVQVPYEEEVVVPVYETREITEEHTTLVTKTRSVKKTKTVKVKVTFRWYDPSTWLGYKYRYHNKLVKGTAKKRRRYH